MEEYRVWKKHIDELEKELTHVVKRLTTSHYKRQNILNTVWKQLSVEICNEHGKQFYSKPMQQEAKDTFEQLQWTIRSNWPQIEEFEQLSKKGLVALQEHMQLVAQMQELEKKLQQLESNYRSVCGLKDLEHFEIWTLKSRNIRIRFLKRKIHYFRRIVLEKQKKRNQMLII